MDKAVKLILHYGRGLRQTPSGHWAYNGHVLFDFVRLRAINGLRMRPEALKASAYYTDDIMPALIKIQAEAFRKQVLECLNPTVELEEHQIEALVSVAHNVGMDNFYHCATVKSINKRDEMKTAIEHILHWTKINVHGLGYYQLQKDSKNLVHDPDLIIRRKAEIQLFLTGEVILDRKFLLHTPAVAK